MSIKLKNKARAREWFERAASDLKYAEAGEQETSQHHITCFLAHQCVEKILKGLIAGAEAVPEKTHSLRKLLVHTKQLYSDCPVMDAEVIQLDAFYIPSRYPGPIERDFTADDATTALSIASRLITICSETLVLSS